MNNRDRLRPPKVRFETVKGTLIIPSIVPSGATQCTPSPALLQRLPS